jgi:1-deoxyxylulose-5-phosphate synthase
LTGRWSGWGWIASIFTNATGIDKETPLEETLGALDRAVKAGKVRAIGFSEWTAEQIDAAARIAARSGLTAFSSSQPQYSMLWRKPEGAVFAACARHGIGNLAFSPLAHGVLTGSMRRGSRLRREAARPARR